MTAVAVTLGAADQALKEVHDLVVDVERIYIDIRDFGKTDSAQSADMGVLRGREAEPSVKISGLRLESVGSKPPTRSRAGGEPRSP